MSAARNSTSRRVENSPDEPAPPAAKPGATTSKASGKAAPGAAPTGPMPEVAPADPNEGPAAHVIEALVRVMRDMPGIGKNRTSAPAQGSYAYRGIEDITPHTQTLFARHGVLLVPRVVSWQIRPITVGGNPWMDVVEEIEYTAYGPGGPDDKITVGPIVAIGRDNSDKGSNKCLTQAEKYALIQLLQIADRDTDADGTTPVAETVEGHHRGQGAEPPPTESKYISQEEVSRLVALVKALPEEARTLVREQWTHVDPMDDEPFLPVDDQGRPHFGLIPPHMVGALEAMVVRIQKATSGRSSDPQPAAPAPPPETPPAPAPAPEKTEEGPTSWNEIIDGVRLLTEEQLREELSTRDLLEEGMDPVKMRAALVNAIGLAAGLSLSNITADAATRKATEAAPTEESTTAEES